MAGRRPRRLGVSLNALADPRPAGDRRRHPIPERRLHAWIKGGITPELRAELDKREMLTAAGMPYSLDKWDGYPAARTRLYDAARQARANLVTLTGDSHNAWAFDLDDEAGAVGVEFAGQSVSSYGFERRFNGDAARLASDFMAANPNLKWMDTSQRGYFTLDIRPDRIDTEFVFVPADRRTQRCTETGRKRLGVDSRRSETSQPRSRQIQQQSARNSVRGAFDTEIIVGHQQDVTSAIAPPCLPYPGRSSG